MGSLNIIINGLDRVIAKYGRDKAEKAAALALDDTMNYTSDLVKQKVAGKHHVTGWLVNSIGPQRISSSQGRVYAREGGAVYYAPFVEQGTGIYGPNARAIRPKSAKVLAWHSKNATGNKKTGSIVRRSVKGQRPVHMFQNTFVQDRPRIISRFNTSFRRQFLGV